MDCVHHIWCPLFSQEFQDLPDGAETTLTLMTRSGADLHPNPTGRHIREEYGHQGTFNPFSELRFFCSYPDRGFGIHFLSGQC
ncbi:hypothetical protein E0K68_23225 [Escherichia coli]|nr:hypothetical protein E0K68_23225 [Escherichia coli]